MHTPGPWATDGYSVVSPNGDTPDGIYEIASVRKSGDIDLIASAPDLLEALEAIDEEIMAIKCDDIDITRILARVARLSLNARAKARSNG